jgi:cobalamin biosynthesis protein CobT
MQLMKRESGMNNYQQSHKNHLTNLSINSFLQYAQQHNICCTENRENNYIPARVDDVYFSGVFWIQNKFQEKGSLDCFKPPVLFDQEMAYQSNDPETESEDVSGESETGNERETSNEETSDEDSSKEDSSDENSSKKDSSEESSEHS